MLCHSPWGQPAGESTAMASLLHALLCSLRAMLSALAVWLQNGELWLRSGLRGLCSVPHALCTAAGQGLGSHLGPARCPVPGRRTQGLTPSRCFQSPVPPFFFSISGKSYFFSLFYWFPFPVEYAMNWQAGCERAGAHHPQPNLAVCCSHGASYPCNCTRIFGGTAGFCDGDEFGSDHTALPISAGGSPRTEHPVTPAPAWAGNDALCRRMLVGVVSPLQPEGPSGEGRTWGGMEDELDTLLSDSGLDLLWLQLPPLVGRDDAPNRGCSTSAAFPVLIHHPCGSGILQVVQVSSPSLSGPGGPLCSLSVPFEL